MSPTDLLVTLEERNVRLSLAGDELVVRGEKRNLDAGVLGLLREHKASLIDLLRSGEYVTPAPGGLGAMAVPPNLIPPECTALTPAMLPLVDLTEEELESIVSAVPGGAANVQDIYPLAPLQEGILFHHLLATEGDPYLQVDVMRFDARERLDQYLAALQAVIDRHDVLRTAVVWSGLRQSVQVVWRKAVLPVEEFVLEGETDVAAELRRRFDSRCQRIDIASAPLLRAFITRDPAAGWWYLVMLSHHLTTDHVSHELLLSEVQAHLLGRADELPLPPPFRTFVMRARQQVSEAEHEAFFRGMLGTVDEPTAPYGLLQVHGDGAKVAEANMEVERGLAARIRRRARRAGVTAASLYHLAWAQVLARVCGRDDVVFGTVLLGRMQGGEGADRAMGLFMNTLPVRIVLAGDSVEASVRRTHQLLTDLLRHEHASLALAQRCSAVQPPTPLFSSFLNFRHSGGNAEAPPADLQRAWEGIDMVYADGRTNYPLSLNVDDFGDIFHLNVQALPPIDAAGVCALMHAALERLVEALETAPDTPVRTMDVLPAAERHRILYEWNDTRADLPGGQCVHELFEARVEQTPAAVALVAGDGREITYRDLNARANQLAYYLRDLGVGPDERVAICQRRGIDLIVSMLAVLKAGGAYVPLDPAYPHERLAYMLADAGASVVLTDGTSSIDEAVGSRIPLLDVSDPSPLWRDRPHTNLDRGATGLRPGHLAYVIYTSGSTGAPKGVMVEHRGVRNLLHWYVRETELSPRDVALVATSYSFDLTQRITYGPLLAGARLVLAPEPFDPQAIVALMAQQGVTMTNVTPGILHALLAASRNGEVGRLERVFLGGEPIQIAQLAGMPEPRPAFVNNYGPTECTATATYHRLSSNLGEYGAGVPIGRPIPNVRVYILDAARRPAPVGVPGEIYIGGDGVGRGYLNRPELTAEKFVADRFSSDPNAKMYKTGDLGRFRADGNIEFLGRNDFQVKVRGFRIELQEIEARLVEHPDVRQAVVMAQEAAGDKRLVAYVAPVPGHSIDVDELRRHAAAYLPDYMVPAAYVRVDVFPLTPNGKIDRKSLPAADGEAYAARTYEAPRGENETAIAGIWKDLLQLDEVGRQDSFFDLGGHSILAIQLISRLREAIGVEVPLNAPFTYPVLADFAAHVAGSRRSTLPPVLPASDAERQVLSFAQQRLWFLAQLDGQSAAYHVPFALTVDGDLDRDALRRALDTLVARHEVLRTTFVVVDGAPRQRIAPRDGSRFALFEHDLRGAADPDGEWKQLTAEEASGAFDLEQGPLIRGRLIRTADTRHTLLITQHHIVSDGWSMGILLSELSALYGAYREGQADPLPPLRVQYADFAAWQRRWVADELLQEQTDYWKATLAGAPALLELPADRPRPAEQDFTGGSVGVALDQELTERLRELSRRHGTTLFMTLLASWAAVLGRLAGQDDVIIGTPTANRGHAELEELIGFFVNTLTLRIDLSGQPSVGELLARVKEQALSAQENQDIPFEQVVEIVRPARSLAHSPLFQVMFAWGLSSGEALDLPGLTLIPERSGEEESSKFDLTISLNESDTAVAGAIEYAAALFDQSTIERYVGHWRTFLAAMVADDDRAIHELPLLTAAEEHQLVHEWNATEAGYPREQCIHELFEAQVERTPDAVAVVSEDQELRYAELNARANQLAHELRSRGLQPDDRVVVCTERGASVVVALLAVLKAGGAYVPLDPSYPAERLAYMVTDSAPVAVLTDGENAGVAALFGDVPVLDLTAAAWSHQPRTNPSRQEIGLSPEHLAYVIYTSGSTGAPKGVMARHRNLVSSNTARAAVYPRIGRFLLLSSPAFDSSVAGIFGALLSGGTLCIASRELTLDPLLLSATIESLEIDSLLCVPNLYQQLLEYPLRRGKERRLSIVTVAGEACPATLVARSAERAPNVVLFNEYGPTECTVWATVHTCTVVPGESTVPIGRPIENTRIYVLDPRGQVVPVGVTGEIHIGGAGVAVGYWRRPDLTAEKFVRDPFSPEPDARMYRTGDLGRYRADGTLEFLGRNDQQVKIRGFRIELGEIESCLAQHPAVRDVVVLARTDQADDPRLVAYVVPVDGVTVDADALRKHARTQLPDYMVPVAYVRLDALPLTPNGKVDRKALPAPGGGSYAMRSYEAPEGEIETALVEIWSDLLRIEQIGRNDNFFELGGHSFLAVTLIERMRQRELRADVSAIFKAPTIAELAAAVAVRRSAVEVPPNLIPEGCETLTPEMLPLVRLTPAEIDVVTRSVPGGAANIQDVYPLAPLQDGILFHHLIGEAGDPYVSSRMLRFENRERLQDYLDALQAVVDRHDVLRTAVLWEGLSVPVQVVWRQVSLAVEEVSVDPAADAVDELFARFDRRRYRMNIGEAPLLRIAVADDAQNGGCLLLMCTHHLAIDHTTIGVIHSELEAHLLGQEAALPAPLPFRNFVAEARSRTTEEEQQVFFRRMLGDVDTPTAPFGLLRVQGNGSGTAQARLMLETAMSLRLRERARLLGVSCATMYHVAWAQVLARACRSEDVVFGTVLFGRSHGSEGAERILGLFLNTLPVRITFGEETIAAGVRRTHSRLADLMRFAHASLALAQRCSGVRAPAPLFTALFNYRHNAGLLDAPPPDSLQAWEGIEEIYSEERTNYPLVLSVDDYGDRFGLTVQVESSVDAAHLCELMRLSVEALIDACESAPELPIRSLLVKSVDADEPPIADAEQDALRRSASQRFWREMLQDAELVPLPRWTLDAPTGPAPRQVRAAAIDGALVSRLRDLAGQAGTPLSSVLFTAHVKVMSRLQGSSDVLTGVVPDRRSASHTSTLPFRARLTGSSWLELVRAIFILEECQRPHRNDSLPAAQDGEGSDRPFDTAFACLDGSDRTPAEDAGVSLMTAFTVAEEWNRIELSLRYDSGIVTPEHAAEIEAMYLRALARMTEVAGAPHEVESLLAPARLHEIVHGWNATERAYDRTVTIHELFERQAAATPGAIAVTDGVRSMTYRQLDERANRIAAHLFERYGAGNWIAVHMARSLEMIPALLAILKSGNAYAPVEISWPAERVRWILDSLPAAAVLTDSARASNLSQLDLAHAVEVIDLETNAFSDASAAPCGAAPDSNELAYVIFTSGSTGTPKGVMVRHQPVINLIEWAQREFAFGAADRVLFVTSLSFDLSVFDVFGILATGGSIRVASNEEVADPERLVAILRNEPITFWDTAPAALQQLTPFFGERRGSSLRIVFLSGDWIPLPLPDQVRTAFPRAEVIALGGATEATVWSNFHRVGVVDPRWSSIPYGRPMQNARYHVLDAEGVPAPVGVAGDLHIGGECLSTGYLHEAALTATKFVPDPFAVNDGGRLYRTGDRARYWPDGTIEFLGRVDHQVKIRGYRVELGEIEAVLQTHEAVRHSIVIARGERTSRSLAAYVIADGSVDTAALRVHLRERLPEYMVPAAFVFLDSFPVTANGKLDRNALPEPSRIREQDLSHDAIDEGDWQPPTGAAEILVADIWKGLLRIDRVDRRDSFVGSSRVDLQACKLEYSIVSPK